MLQQVLQSELNRRKRANPAYSVRSFARYLELSPGRLSELLNGKREPGKRLEKRLLERLELKAASPQPMEDHAFAVIADWQHFAILSLMDTKNFSSRPDWIAKRLGISTFDAQAAIDRLVKVGLAHRKNGRLFKSDAPVVTPTDRASQALRISHEQSLMQAIRALQEIPVPLRDVTSITLAMNPAKLGLAKEMIRDFRRRLANVLESEDCSEVYNLNIQLVPVTTVLQSAHKEKI